jgi:uncharacterized protein with GYD domain
MPNYVLLGRFTRQGLERIDESPERLEAARKTLEGLGGKLKQFYLTTGQYDLVVTIEAPDDEAAAKFSIATGARGNVRFETLRAFDEDEYRKLIRELP